MEPIIHTPRLKLTLITKAERGSEELEWMHELRSNEKVTFWSIHGQSKSLADTEKIFKSFLPTGEKDEYGNPKSYRVDYAVHKLLHPGSNEPDQLDANEPSTVHSSRFIGHISLRSVGGPHDLVIPSSLFPSPALSPDTLMMELGYQFLPSAWGHGFAAESLRALFETCRNPTATSFWGPYEKVYMRAIVNCENGQSQSVMRKAGVERRGIYVWKGEKVWIAGKWTEESELWIFGGWLVGEE